MNFRRYSKEKIRVCRHGWMTWRHSIALSILCCNELIYTILRANAERKNDFWFFVREYILRITSVFTPFSQHSWFLIRNHKYCCKDSQKKILSHRSTAISWRLHANWSVFFLLGHSYLGYSVCLFGTLRPVWSIGYAYCRPPFVPVAPIMRRIRPIFGECVLCAVDWYRGNVLLVQGRTGEFGFFV